MSSGDDNKIIIRDAESYEIIATLNGYFLFFIFNN